MMKQILLFLSLLLFMSCSKKEVPVETQEFSGYIYMACDFGPYYLDFTLLQENCSVEGLLSNNIIIDSIDVESICLYDGNPEIVGNSEEYDVIFQRDTIVINHPDYELTEINWINGGTEYEWDTYPFYLGYNIRWDNNDINIYMVNRYIGGCFHDMILWENMVQL